MTAVAAAPGARAVWASPAMRVSAGLLLWSAAWNAVMLAHPVGPALIGWLLVPVSLLVAAALCWQAGRAPTVAEPTRRFWRWAAVSVAVSGLSTVSRLIDSLNPDLTVTARLSLGTSLGHAVGLGLLVWPLFRLPLGTVTRARMAAFWLDVGTIMVAAAVFMWHFSAPAIAGLADSTATVAASVALMVCGLAGVFVVVKVAMTGSATVERSALRLLGGALTVGGAGSAMAPLFVGRPYVDASLLVLPAAAFLIALAARRQVTVTVPPLAAFAPRGPRRYSLLPYVAVGATDGLLLFAIAQDATDRMLIGVFAVALTGLVVIRQVTAFRENATLLGQLDHAATHDVLTGLANRALFGERLQHSVTHADPNHRLSLVLIDLDDFKVVNDTLGHAVGDAMLATVGHRMTAAVRPQDTVARLGGDEFAILLEDCRPGAVDRVVARVAEALKEPMQVDGHRLSTRASFGVADGRTGDDAGALLRQADVAMYEAKELGEGGCQRYRPGMQARGAERVRLAAELRAALTEGQLRLFYQPVVALPGGRITGLEALVRWQHPARGLLGPHEFIAIAEQTGLIVPLGRWVLREACAQAASWLTEHGVGSPASISVNASARQLREPSFADEVAAALTESGLPACRLIIEITESTAVGGGATQQSLRQLRTLGVRLALDDFGTGASTLSLLASCPVDQIKLDRSFAPAPGAESVATAVVQLARALGLEAVAEGVETPAQAERLRLLGYEQAQGFHFARPMPPWAISRALTEAARRPV